MKSIRKFLSVLMVIVLLFLMCACSGAASDRYGGILTDTMAPGEASPEGSTDKNSPTEEQVSLPSGVITAGAWNDNDHYAMWQALFNQAAGEDAKDGKFYTYTTGNKDWGFHSLKRVKVTVNASENAVAGADAVALDADGNVLFIVTALEMLVSKN